MTRRSRERIFCPYIATTNSVAANRQRKRNILLARRGGNRNLIARYPFPKQHARAGTLLHRHGARRAAFEDAPCRFVCHPCPRFVFSKRPAGIRVSSSPPRS